MILLDAYTLVAFLGEERAAGEVEELLRRGTCAISVVNLAEAVDVSVRVHELSLDDVQPVIEMLVRTQHLELVAPSEAVAWRAAALRQAHYRPRASEISLADCFLLAAAGPGDEIATADAPVALVARRENLGVVALPDSRGRRP